MKHLGMSGGGTAISGLFGAAESIMLDKNYKPDIISGISAGSILSVPLAMGKFSLLKPIITSFGFDDFFDKKNRPVNKKGNFTFKSIWNVLTGKPYLGKQTGLPTALSKIITSDDFKIYQEGDYAECWVGAINFVDGSRFYVNLKDKSVSYESYLKYVSASSNVPIFTEPIYVDGKILYDGGVRDHISTPWVLENVYGITETVSIYTRPNNYKLADVNWKPKNVLDVAKRYISIVNMEISKTDELMEDDLCQDKNIIQHKIFLPKITHDLYDISPERLELLYNTAKKIAFDTF